MFFFVCLFLFFCLRFCFWLISQSLQSLFPRCSLLALCVFIPQCCPWSGSGVVPCGCFMCCSVLAYLPLCLDIGYYIFAHVSLCLDLLLFSLFHKCFMLQLDPTLHLSESALVTISINYNTDSASQSG